MDEFIQFLEKKRVANPKKRSFYALWIRNLYNFLNKRPGDLLNDDEIARFLSDIGGTYHDWQVQQAQESIQLYLHYQRKPRNFRRAMPAGVERLWSGAVEQMVSFMRLRHMSLRTEETYLHWMRQFYRQVRGVPPNELNSDHVIGFLTYLAVDRKVSRATQNQAFNAILFFFRHILKQEIGDLWKSMRAKK